MIELAPTPSPSMHGEPPASSLDELGDRIAELSAQIQAADYRLLVMIREFDEREGWGEGFRSCAHWLNWRVGLHLGAAREKVRVARSLGRLPLLSGAMRRGELSYSKVRALTRVATADNEEELLHFATAGTASHVERLVRAWRRVDAADELAEANRRRTSRHLQIYTDDDGMVVVRGRLEPEAGAVLRRALEAAADRLYDQAKEEKDEDGDGATLGQRRADALALVAESALTHELDPGTRGDRYQVVVHVDAAVLEDPSEPGASVLEDGQNVPAGTSRRLACDAARVVMLHDREGRILDVGRKTRTTSPALRRALDHRDGRCQFPGCEVAHCEAHHLHHWANGGETSLENLTLLCKAHHRAVHEGGFTVERLPDGGLRFRRPDGRVLPAAAPPRPARRDLLAEWAAQRVRDGVSIDASTGHPSWEGGWVDFDWAVEGIRSGAGGRASSRSSQWTDAVHSS